MCKDVRASCPDTSTRKALRLSMVAESSASMQARCRRCLYACACAIILSACVRVKPFGPCLHACTLAGKGAETLGNPAGLVCRQAANGASIADTDRGRR